MNYVNLGRSGLKVSRIALGMMTYGTPAWRDWTAGYDPDASLDRAILATREAVFSLHGLDPMP